MQCQQQPASQRVRWRYESAGNERVQIPFALKRTGRRTLSISVLPDGAIEVVAPKNAPLELVRSKILKRRAWIRKQQIEFIKHPPALPAAKKFESGDTLRYLGRQYLLKLLRDRNAERVSYKIEGNRFVVRVQAPSDTRNVRKRINDWYLRQSRIVFDRIVAECAVKLAPLGIRVPEFALRRMGKRLGSCAPSGRLLLDPRLVEVSTGLIEFVVVHELCHQKEMNHGPAFFRLMDRALPDWRARERRLLRFEFSE